MNELRRRRRELERQLEAIDRELMPLCPMKARAGELQEQRRLVMVELDAVRTQQARLRGDCPRPRAAVWDRKR